VLLLTFRTGESFYAVEGRHVVEVLPRVDTRPIPHAPSHVLGLLSYRGLVLPVVDFAEVVGGARCREALSTRIILTEFQAGTGRRHRLGLVAESVEEVVRAEAGQLVLAEMNLGQAPYLGPVYRFDDRLVQVVKPGLVLDGPLRRALFGEPAEAG
jgi:chemotaxis-related protein WspB